MSAFVPLGHFRQGMTLLIDLFIESESKKVSKKGPFLWCRFYGNIFSDTIFKITPIKSLRIDILNKTSSLWILFSDGINGYLSFYHRQCQVCQATTKSWSTLNKNEILLWKSTMLKTVLKLFFRFSQNCKSLLLAEIIYEAKFRDLV